MSLFSHGTLKCLYRQLYNKDEPKEETDENLTIKILDDFISSLKFISPDDIKRAYRCRYPFFNSYEELVPDIIYFFEGDNQDDCYFLKAVFNDDSGKMDVVYCDELKEQMDKEILNVIMFFTKESQNICF